MYHTASLDVHIVGMSRKAVSQFRDDGYKSTQHAADNESTNSPLTTDSIDSIKTHHYPLQLP